MINLSEIKCIIWDLDETFWGGVLSENDNIKVTPIHRNIDFIRQVTEYGIINSICSKNDENAVREEFERAEWDGIWNYFVMNSIDWTSKGPRLHSQIESLQLRAENVLFIDDNPSNLAEASYYCPGIMVSSPGIVNDLIIQLKEFMETHSKKNRLPQYRILEEKRKQLEKCDSNESFLRNSHICIQVIRDCEQYKERIVELIARTNQLNYTKKRSTLEEISELIADKSIVKGVIHVYDDFGDYGICGFYAVKKNDLIHFLFSCRIMGMGIEQYMFAQLGYPTLRIVGEVAYTVNYDTAPDWITKVDTDDKVFKEEEKCESGCIFVKGPCDLSQTFNYLDFSGKIETEMIYVNEKNGITMEAYNHSTQIVQALLLTDRQKELLQRELPFVDENSFSAKIFENKYDVVFYSVLTDPNLGLYRRKETGEVVAFGEWCYDMTDPINWDAYVNETIFTANFKPSYEFLQSFAKKYEYLGKLSVDEIVKNIILIRKHIAPQTILCLFLGSEVPYEKNVQRAFIERELVHKELNQRLRKLAETDRSIRLIDFTNYVESQKDYFNNINHMRKLVYYKAAQDISLLINECLNTKKAGVSSIENLKRDQIRQKIKKYKLMILRNPWIGKCWRTIRGYQTRRKK